MPLGRSDKTRTDWN